MDEVAGAINIGVVINHLAPDTEEGRVTLASQMATVHAFANPTPEQELFVEQLDKEVLGDVMGVTP